MEANPPSTHDSDCFVVPATGNKPPSVADQKEGFLKELSTGMSVRAAALAVSIKPEEPYLWRREDAAFAERWKLAEEAGTDLIEEEAYRRAVTGVEKPVYRGGEVVGHVADYSDSMLMFIGWICGLALGWHFLGSDIANWLRLAFFPDMPPPPALNGTETLVTVLLSMLGLGGLRTVEKLKGVSRDNWQEK